MFKKFLSFNLLIFFVLASCSGKEEGADVIKLSFGHIQNPGHSLYIAAENFKNLVESKSGGRVVINIYPSSQLGTAREMMEQTTIGTLDMTFAATSDWAIGLNIPELSVFELPFLYANIEQQQKVIEEILPQEVEKMLADSSVKLMFTYLNGIRNSLTKTKPINTINDIKGLKMRTPESVLSVDMWKNLGAINVTSPWSDVYTVLQQGVSDAIEADAVGMVNMNLQEVGKYYSRTAHMGNIYIICINKNKWDSIPEDLQKIIQEAGIESQRVQMEGRKAEDEAAEKILQETGVILNDVSQEERMKMRDAEKSIYDQFSKQYQLEDLVQKLLSIN